MVNRPLRDAAGHGRGGTDPAAAGGVLGADPVLGEGPQTQGRMFNARVESVADQPTRSAGAYAKRRCLVPADGWYEWQVVDARRPGKQPLYMTPADGHSVAFAGLYEFWRERGRDR